MSGSDADAKRSQKAGLSKRMTAEAEHRRCPRCRRKGAITRHVDGGFVLRVCRYCGLERGRYMG